MGPGPSSGRGTRGGPQSYTSRGGWPSKGPPSGRRSAHGTYDARSGTCRRAMGGPRCHTYDLMGARARRRRPNTRTGLRSWATPFGRTCRSRKGGYCGPPGFENSMAGPRGPRSANAYWRGPCGTTGGAPRIGTGAASIIDKATQPSTTSLPRLSATSAAPRTVARAPRDRSGVPRPAITRAPRPLAAAPSPPAAARRVAPWRAPSSAAPLAPSSGVGRRHAPA